MSTARDAWWWQLPRWMAAVVVLRVTAGIVLGSLDYFPPDFNADFLRGREATFFGSYQWAFYPHVVVGPLTMLLGLLLVSTAFRTRWPQWHRRLGRLQVLCVLGVIAPSGLWMACYTQTGPFGMASFVLQSVLTGVCAALGWRAAVQRRFAIHRRWMLRTFALLLSAIVLRVLAGTATLFGYGPAWFDPLAIWLSWTLPLAVIESWPWLRARILGVKTASSATPGATSGTRCQQRLS